MRDNAAEDIDDGYDRAKKIIAELKAVGGFDEMIALVEPAIEDTYRSLLQEMNTNLCSEKSAQASEAYRV